MGPARLHISAAGAQRGGEILFSRIDRIYCNAHPAAYEDFLIQVAVRGAWEGWRVASDHLAVVARVALRRGRGRRQVQPNICMHESFPATNEDEIRVYQTARFDTRPS